ncbi:hypothetical protein Gogos_022000 [Gossypium gossypioides]|uniref:Pyruvate kinase barrel domain-containing protein n=1 Tax=Gossypium gossypioides TaxID=34282 RepID=A0A7J9CZE9_GOSGO|nr:hypothetical protein [Gossypium gossypioides]
MAGKPAVVTRVVDSMTDNFRPTRAEATDVVNAVLDGSDAIFLGVETLRGLYPVETISTVGKICTKGYELQRFLEGTLFAPPKLVASPEGALTPNPDVSVFNQQDNFTTNRPFVASTSAKVSCIKHDLHSTKKGDLTVKEYIAKIDNICALLAASGSAVSKAEKVKVVLAGHSSNFDAVLTLASFSMEPLLFQQLVDVLMEFESRHMRVAREVPMHAHLVETLVVVTVVDSVSHDVHEGRATVGSQGRGFRRDMQSNVGRALGQRRAQRVGPSAVAHRPSHAGQFLGQNNGQYFGPNAGQSLRPVSGQNNGQHFGPRACQSLGPISGQNNGPNSGQVNASKKI